MKYASWEAAIQDGLILPYALLRYKSSVYLGRTPKTVDLDTLEEARFFGECHELYLFTREGAQCTVLRVAEEIDDFLVETRPIQDRTLGISLTVAYTLETDEDGQVYRDHCRLVHWEGGGS